MLKIGDEATMPAFTENLRGASPEEAREFEVTYPEDYERETLAGTNGAVPRRGEGRAPQGTARAERRIRQGSGRLQDAGRAEGHDPQIDLAGARTPGAGRGQAPVAGQAGGRARFSGAGSVRRPADRDQRRKPAAALAAQGIDPRIDQARLGEGAGVAEGSRRARREGVADAG